MMLDLEATNQVTRICVLVVYLAKAGVQSGHTDTKEVYRCGHNLVLSLICF